jgi:SAM-dependent MidA family methyltransferase
MDSGRQRTTNLTPGLYRFDQFYWARIYGPGGYYETGNGVGKDFETFVSLDNKLSDRIGQWLDAEWERLGKPNPYPVYEIAAGNGTLCRKLLAQNLACRSALRYTAVESNPLYKESFPDEVAVTQQLDQPPAFGVMFANELLDVQPMRFVSFRDDRWQELFIRVADTAIYEWHDLNEPIPATLQAIKGMDGSAPWIQQAADLLHNLTRNLTGSVLMLDYGFRNTTDFPGSQWFNCVKNNKLQRSLDLTIQCDMSTLIPIDQLEELFRPAKVTEQSTWIQNSLTVHDGFYAMEWFLES